MTLPFADMVALVTGCATGIGRATAAAYAQAGATVLLADLESPLLREAEDELTRSGYRALAVPCDVTDEDEVANLVTAGVEKFGRIDVAYNNAGVQPSAQRIEDVDLATFDQVLAVNLRGVFTCLKYELAQMRTQGSGAIVNCSSVGGLVGAAGQAAYHASKHGVLGLTKSAALEYAAHSIRVNAVSPGPIDTPLVEGLKTHNRPLFDAIIRDVPMERIGAADEVARAVLWLTGPESSYITGTNLVIDGGVLAG